MKEFDEIDAIAYIREHLGKEKSDFYSDDDLIEVIDLTFDFFEQFSEDDDIDIEISLNNGVLTLTGDDAESLFDYVCHLISKDKSSKIKLEDIPAIVTGEILYEESLS